MTMKPYEIADNKKDFFGTKNYMTLRYVDHRSEIIWNFRVYNDLGGFLAYVISQKFTGIYQIYNYNTHMWETIEK